MKKNKALAFAVFILSLTLTTVFCAQTGPQRATDQDRANWQLRMQKLSRSLTELLPLVISKKEFDNPDNYRAIERETKELAELSHDIKATRVKPNGDPGMEFVSRKFFEDMADAHRQLVSGNREYARFVIKNTTSFCISCHTRNEEGRKDLGIDLASANVSNFTTLEKAQYHLAVREFDKALNDFDKAVNDREAYEDPQGIQLTAERALAVAVRVRRDPALASELVSRIVDSKWAPIYLRLNAREWKVSLKEWEKELKKAKAKDAQKPEKLLSQAKALLAQGWSHTADALPTKAGLVDFLRASTLLHDLMGTDTKPDVYGEGLYYAGLAAESLREINLWTLHEAYYESCIRYQPYTNLAKKCYLRLESLLLSSYTTYGGGFLPANVRDNLAELKSLSEKTDGDFLEWGFVE